MQYFFLVGEASGDLHASQLLKQLKLQDPTASFSGFGGDKMAAQGCRLYRHIHDLAFMGFVAVLENISTIRQNFTIAKQALLDEQPDVLILVDYPSFNLKMAAFARHHLPNIKIVYYIPPKVWAWKKWRRKRILSLCDQVLCIFPFEPAFYNPQSPIHNPQSPIPNPQVIYVGNPTAEEVLSSVGSLSAQRSKIIALLPGSRRSEIKHCLPKMLAAASRFPDYEIRISQAPSIPTEFYEQVVGESTLPLYPSTPLLLQAASVAIVNSGTATLEAALLGCPEVTVYHVACPNLMRLIWKAMFTIRHFTLPNILLDKRDEKGQPVESIREMIAYLFTVDNIEAEIRHILTNENYRQTMLADFDTIRQLLGNKQASVEAARLITETFRSSGHVAPCRGALPRPGRADDRDFGNRF